MKQIRLASIATLLALVGCKTAYDVTTPSKGPNNLDVSKYVAIGNSLTAGYADGALYRSGQENSYPKRLAEQFALIGGGEFKQPLMQSENGIGISGVNLVNKLSLKPATNCLGVTSLAPGTGLAAASDLADLANIGSQGPFNSIAVPGVKALEILSPQLGNPANGPGRYNPYYTRFAATPGVSSMIGEAAAQKPTFVSIWAANNDVLGYATGGGAGAVDSVTTPANVGFAISTMIASFKAANANVKGVIINVPDITSIPYFTTVPFNGLVIDEASATALSAAYKALGITFKAGANGFIIADSKAPGGLRQIKSTELVLLTVPQDSIRCKGWGSQKPIPAKFILDEAEIAKVQNAVVAYNASMRSLAETNGFAYVDMNAKLVELKKGLVINGVNYSATFVSGNSFSLDGVHLTAQGYAIVANYIIEAINAKYGSTIPTVNPTKYPGVTLP
ncbi:MAG: SGNH/GDSL hydrolase family protein [Cytophagales bacterium]